MSKRPVCSLDGHTPARLIRRAVRTSNIICPASIRQTNAGRDRKLAALEAWQALTETEDYSTARAWFIGTNGDLGESPAEALRHGRTEEVVAAAVAYAQNGGMGL